MICPESGMDQDLKQGLSLYDIKKAQLSLRSGKGELVWLKADRIHEALFCIQKMKVSGTVLL
jgi:hypothetical protein